MNRRGFFGAIAGAFVGGVFARLAPAVKLASPRAGGLTFSRVDELLRQRYHQDIHETIMRAEEHPFLAMIARMERA